MRVVQLFAQEPRHDARFAVLNDENRDANMMTVNLNAAYFPGVELLSALVQAGILLYGGVQAIEGDVTVGVLVAFIAALQNFFDPIQQLSQLYTTYQAGMAALDKIFELLDEEPDLVDAPGAIELTHVRGEIAFEDVTFAYEAARTRPRWPTSTSSIPPGQTVALVGSTGAGKSTFAKLVARFHDPTSGRVLIDGHDLRDVTQRSLRAQLGIVPAGGVPVLAAPSPTTSPSAARTRRATTSRAAARAVGADDFIAALPDGYDTHVGERGAPLLGRPAPARRLRPRADRRPAHPRARRGDLERRHPHGDAHRGRPAAAARRPHGDRHRPPPVHDPAAPAGSSCSTTAASPSRARTTS